MLKIYHCPGPVINRSEHPHSSLCYMLVNISFQFTQLYIIVELSTEEQSSQDRDSVQLTTEGVQPQLAKQASSSEASSCTQKDCASKNKEMGNIQLSCGLSSQDNGSVQLTKEGVLHQLAQQAGDSKASTCIQDSASKNNDKGTLICFSNYKAF